jgi:curved DNA-binding protein CbpA
MPDYYAVLQVHPRAEPEVIRAAYRILARKHHPDLGGDPNLMIALNDAWDVLGDPVRRAEYDSVRFGAVGAPAGYTPRSSEPGFQSRAETGSTAGSAEASRWASGSDVPHAGPPPGRPSGTVLDFGRYAGWSLGEIARHDLDYLEWLQRSTAGRRLRAEIEVLLAGRRGPNASGRSGSGQAWPGRR